MEYKSFTFVEAKMSEDSPNGMLTGYASTFNNVDSYADTIPSFLHDGFIAWSHDWANPVATPVAVHEDSRGLYLTAEFHTHAEAQRARSIAAERIARGKSMGLSIGYEVLDFEMRTVDTPFRGAFGEMTDQVRVLKRIKLYEVSLVTVPADSAALVTAAKSFTGHGLDFEEHADAFDLSLKHLLARIRSGSERRVKEGRAISSARRDRMAGVSESLRVAATEIDALLEETAPPQKQAAPDVAAAYAAFLAVEARRLGVAV